MHAASFALAALVLFLLAVVGVSASAVVLAGEDLQAAVDGANPCDVLVVQAGEYEPFTVDKPLTLRGAGGPNVSARIQTPAITIEADGVAISGFSLHGVSKSPEGKFKYYMEASDRSPRYVLDLPNAAVLVDANHAIIEEIEIEGAEVGVLVDGGTNVTIRNDTFQICDIGVKLLDCRMGRVESCRFETCKKYGAYVEDSNDIALIGNEIADTSSAGMMLKRASRCLLEGNLLTGNWHGIFLWNTTLSQVRENRVDRNLYYGMVISSGSNNTIADNTARDNGDGMGIGISLQENSTHNLVARNLAENNLNGLEVIDGCEFNLICHNEVLENGKGIRVKENQNNLIYRNNFKRNQVSARDNSSHNFWNATEGNYYDDYRGRDRDGDGVGDDPYWIPSGSSCAVDCRPLMEPLDEEFDLGSDLAEAKRDLLCYATYQPEEELPYKVEDDRIVIGGLRKPTESWWSKGG